MVIVNLRTHELTSMTQIKPVAHHSHSFLLQILAGIVFSLSIFCEMHVPVFVHLFYSLVLHAWSCSSSCIVDIERCFFTILHACCCSSLQRQSGSGSVLPTRVRLCTKKRLVADSCEDASEGRRPTRCHTRSASQSHCIQSWVRLCTVTRSPCWTVRCRQRTARLSSHPCVGSTRCSSRCCIRYVY